MMLSRRRLMSAATGLAFAGLARRAGAAPAPDLDPATYASEAYGYGPLKLDPAGLFDLPEGFDYTVVSRAGETMSDGLLVPHKMDGMGCFALDARRVVLVRNHELKHMDGDFGAFGRGRALASRIARDRFYDFDDGGLPLVGGATTLVYDLQARRVERQHLSLAGTSTNCAGGTTPWGSWLSCEETTQAAGMEVGKNHGYVFEIPSAATGLVSPSPLAAMGRFRHEAACVDPRTGVVYLTEDESDGRGLFYRFLPADRTRLGQGGRLQVLGFRDQPQGGDARNWNEVYWKVGDRKAVAWLDVDGVDNPYEDLRWRGHAAGGAWFARGEGVHFGEGSIYFTCTDGGPGRLGQVMRYRPSPIEGQAGEASDPGSLELFVESADPRLMEMGDNIAVSPWGHLFVCEDKAGGVNFLKAVTPQGRVYTMGRNALMRGGDVGDNSELAGVCFSPDGTTLFVNVYWPGTTFAITGPWSSFRT